MSLTQARIQEIIEDVKRKYEGINSYPDTEKNYSGCQGCFENIESAVYAAKESQKVLASLSLSIRKKIILSMREAALNNAKKLAIMANEETGFGRVEDKILKNKLAAEKTPGVEDIISTTYTGDYGLTLVEGAPYGVIGAITPSTNPSATIINNSISMVAAGNAVVYNPHPGAKNTTIETIRILNESIVKAGGPKNLLCTAANPTIETSKKIMEHKDIKLLAVTGGEAVVKVAMKSGKKVIAAGPGNPPVIVDNTANISKAASDIVKGAGFDNNILCIAEKEVFVFNDVAGMLVSEMVKSGCYLAKDSDIQKIMDTVLEINKEGKYVPNKKFVGRNASYILKQSGIDTNTDYRLVIARVENGHPFVKTEMLMPVLPIVNVVHLEEAIDKAVAAENGCGHTAIMHSENVIHMTKAARALNTTIFVKNAPSYAGLGFEGEGYTTLTIATPTGEGLTSAKAFTRQRRCTLSGSFRII